MKILAIAILLKIQECLGFDYIFERLVHSLLVHSSWVAKVLILVMWIG